jgi:hypothetical protein
MSQEVNGNKLTREGLNAEDDKADAENDLKKKMNAITITRRSFLIGCGAFSIPVLWKPLSAQTKGTAVVVRGAGSLGSAEGWLRAKSALDLGLAKLFGIEAPKAWEEVIRSGRPVSVKLDARSPLASTGDALAIGLLESLFDRLIQPWEITVWEKSIADVERRSWRLKTRRGTIRVNAVESRNRQGGYSDSAKYNPQWLGKDKPLSRFASLLEPPPATLINLPAAKHHPLAGIDGALISLAMGSVDNVARYYRSADDLARAVSEIWRRRLHKPHALTVMDATRVVFHGGPVGLPSWTADDGALIIGTDPVAVDAAALGMIDEHRKAASLPPILDAGNAFLQMAEEAGIGSASPRVVEISLPAV